ncbi:MAG: DUF3108 domain-containing protein [Verrucomicrobiota bacterium JB023]|nr:DUF3108 domain-containing protein [Verrucomicrobiota bacterium JB023]
MKTIPLLLAFAALLPLPAQQPAWLSEVTVAKPGPHLRIKPVQLSYQLSWNGTINSGRATFRFGLKDKRYPGSFLVQTFGHSSGVARSVFPFDFTYTSFLKGTNYRPQVFVAEEKGRDEKKNTTNRYTSKGVTSAERETDLETKKINDSSASFPFPQSFDLASALLYVRSLDLKAGQEVGMVVMPFKTPYLAKVKVLAEEAHLGRDALKLGLTLQKIDKDTLKLKQYKKMKTFTLWLSNDAERIPLEFRTKVFIGDVRGVLDSKKRF